MDVGSALAISCMYYKWAVRFFFKFAKQTGKITESILSESYNVKVYARKAGHTKQTLPVVLTSCCHIVFSTLKSKTWVAQLAE